MVEEYSCEHYCESRVVLLGPTREVEFWEFN